MAAQSPLSYRRQLCLRVRSADPRFELQYPIYDAPRDRPTGQPSPTAFTFPSFPGSLERPSSTPRRRYGSLASATASASADGALSLGLGGERRQSAPEARRASPAELQRLGAVAERASHVPSDDEREWFEMQRVGAGQESAPNRANSASEHGSSQAGQMSPAPDALFHHGWALSATSVPPVLSHVGPSNTTSSAPPRPLLPQFTAPVVAVSSPSPPLPASAQLDSNSVPTPPRARLISAPSPPSSTPFPNSSAPFSNATQSTQPPTSVDLTAAATPAQAGQRPRSTLGPRPPRDPAPGSRLGDGLAALVVDDDTLTRRLMSRMLTRLGADVSVAENGQSALDAIGENNFDVVFLDK